MPNRSASPPSTALDFLARALPHDLSADERDAIVGDLTEVFEDRVSGGLRMNRLWFWSQALGFVLGFAGSAIAGGTPHHPRRPLSFFRRLLMGRLATSFRQALRRLVYDWRYAAGVTLILGVGIGPAAAMLSIVENVWLRPLDYRAPDQLGIVRINLGQIQNHPGLALSEVQDLRNTQNLFAGVETEARTYEVSYGPPDDLQPLSAVAVSPGLLSMLGVSPARGRQFTDADANIARGGVQPVLLDYGFWQSRLGGANDIVGHTILINGMATEVAGVLPQGFVLYTGRAVPQPIEIYYPLLVRDFRNFWGYPTLVRLKDGETFEHVNAALTTLTAALTEKYPAQYKDTHLQFMIKPLQDDLVRETRPALRAAMGGVLLLLLIAVANATALVVARLKSRERDFAIRVAIGAGRGAIIAEVLMESFILSAIGTVVGSCVAAAAIAGARILVPHTVPRWNQIALGWELLGYSVAFALIGLFVSGLIPMWKVARSSPWQTLRGTTVQGGRAEGAVSRLLLVGAQIALTVVLAFGAAQLVRSASRLSQVDLGFDPNVLTVRVPMDFRLFPKPEDGARMYQRVRDRVRQVPGVALVGAISHLPLSGSFLTDGYTSDLTKPPGWTDATANYYSVVPGYFASMHMPMLQGRDFTDEEDARGQHLIVVDESLARAAFPGVSDVIGRTLKLGWGIPDSQIIGVVGTVRGIDVTRDVRPQIYAAFGNFTNTPLNLTVRAVGATDPRLLADAVKAAVHEVGPGRALSGFTMLSDNVTAATSTLRSVTGLVTLLAMSAGLLSAVGLYTVLAFVVHQRRRATAIRSALGASRGQLIAHHLRTSGMVILIALPIGVALAAGIAPLFGSLVYGVSERDLTSLMTAACVSLFVGILGTYIPVRRAANVDPVTVLRGE